MIRVLPTGHPAHALELNVDAVDPLTGRTTTLADIEARASELPTFANVRALYDALGNVYPQWRKGVAGEPWTPTS
jgi:hypothetical protein